MAHTNNPVYSPYISLHKGVDEYHNPVDLDNSAMQSAENIHIDQKKVFKRPGKRLWGAAFSNPIDGVHEYIDKDGNNRLLVKSGATLFEATSSANTALDTGLAIEKTHFHNLRGKCFYNSENVQRRLDGTTPAGVGLAPPSAASTVAAGAAGVLTGEYRVKVTFVIEVDGVKTYESNPGTASDAATIAAKKLDVSALPISSDSRVNARYIYKTTSSGSKYWYDGKVQDNTTLTYTSNVADSAVGKQVETNHGQPVQANISASCNERQVWADGSVLRLSEIAITDYHIEYQRATGNFVQMPGTIKGLKSLYNESFGREDLYVFLEESIHILPQGDPLNSMVIANSTFGTIQHNTITEHNGYLVFFTQKNNAAMIRGSKYVDISSRGPINSLESAQTKENMQGSIIFDHYYALTTRHQAGRLYNTRIWLCDMRTIREIQTGMVDAVWFSYTLPAQYVLQRKDGTVLMFNTSEYRIYELALDTNNDEEVDGSFVDITTRFRSKNFYGKSLIALKRPMFLSIHGTFEQGVNVTPYAWTAEDGTEESFEVIESAFVMGISLMGTKLTKKLNLKEEAIDSATVGNTFSFEFESEVNDHFFTFNGFQFTYQTFTRAL